VVGSKKGLHKRAVMAVKSRQSPSSRDSVYSAIIPHQLNILPNDDNISRPIVHSCNLDQILSMTKRSHMCTNIIFPCNDNVHMCFHPLCIQTGSDSVISVKSFR